jgi:drug/metabolite transporter (DMT)-like permease
MRKLLTRRYYSDKRQQATAKTKALFALGVVSIVWGTTWVASKQAVQNMPALQMAGMRQFMGGVLFIVYFLLKKQQLPRGKQWITILILSLLNFMLSNGLSTWGVKYISSGLGSIISAIFPLWVVIISRFAGKRLPQKALLGMLFGFSGVCLIFYEHLKDFLNPDFKFGILLSLVSTVTWAFGTLYTKKHVVNFNPYVSLGFQMFISGIVLFTVAFVTGNTVPFTAIPATSWWAIGYLLLFGSLITFVAYIYTLQHLPATLASVYAYINPIVAVLLGALILNEKLTIFIAAGGAITLAGVYIVNNSINKKLILEAKEAVI